MATKTILFLCTGNSARSQMAEGFARHLASERFEVYSAGTDPKGIHPMAARVMDEVGIDISGQSSKGPEAVPLDRLDHLITLCGDARDNCPVLPVEVQREHWPLEDPARATGTEEEVITVFRKVRDEIKGRVEGLLKRLQ